ncbi:two-component sensor histidine kinase [Gordonia spumicola]|uniref:Two-component sensor histidine kinase n=1 Tax=Gordonia spumicola TaxID=589161 RepID=A0A7I9V967_9ACTN|nr:sensor histidine kinase [Gordonia spumicola]GEE01849.1 two-component sensor histidine kinase [Gordonia spumicola]
MTDDRITDRYAEWGGHVLFATLLTVGVIKSLGDPRPAMTVVAALVFAAWYVVGAVASSRGRRDRASAWVLVLTAGWIGLVGVSEDFVWLAFVLAILCRRFLPRSAAAGAAVVIAIVSVAAVWARQGFTVGGVIGPIIGIATAVAVTEAFERITLTVRERDRLLDELVVTRDELAARQREAGVLAERDRLGGEIHDGVGQYLASIIMLLRADQPDAALETAQAALAESRRFLSGLDGPVRDSDLPGALARQAAELSADGVRAVFADHGDPVDLPDDVHLALLRTAQEALLNVRKHAGASQVTVTLTRLPGEVHLDIVDDGVGLGSGTGFGLRAMRSRVARCGGEVIVDDTPGGGTTVHARVPVGGDA